MKKYIKNLMIAIMLPVMLLVGGCFNNETDDDTPKAESIAESAGFAKYVEAKRTTFNQDTFTAAIAYLDDFNGTVGLFQKRITRNNLGYYSLTTDQLGDESYYSIRKQDNVYNYYDEDGNLTHTMPQEEYEEWYGISELLKDLDFEAIDMYTTVIERRAYEFGDSEEKVSDGSVTHSFEKLSDTYTWKITHTCTYRDLEDNLIYDAKAEITVVFDTHIRSYKISRTIEGPDNNKTNEMIKSIQMSYTFDNSLNR